MKRVKSTVGMYIDLFVLGFCDTRGAVNHHENYRRTQVASKPRRSLWGFTKSLIKFLIKGGLILIAAFLFLVLLMSIEERYLS